MPRKDNAAGPISAQAQQELVSEGIENFELPKSLVTRIAKSAVSENSKLQKEAVLSLVKGSTVFINYLAATAHDVALSKQHKSISASDVLKALETIQFGDLVEQLQGELQAYRELAKTDKSKKGNSNIHSTAGPSVSAKSKAATTNATTTSASTPTSVVIPPLAKLKGKEKESLQWAPLPPPFTSVPLGSATAYERGSGSVSASISASASSGPGVPMDVEDDDGIKGDRNGRTADDEDAEMAPGDDQEQDEEEEEEEQLDEEEEDEEETQEELQDVVAMEDEEVRRDAKGLEYQSESE